MNTYMRVRTLHRRFTPQDMVIDVYVVEEQGTGKVNDPGQCLHIVYQCRNC
jgi:hypothetical protein